MRKLTFFLLLATAAAPALAAADRDSDRESRRAARAERAAESEESESRPQRAERAERKAERVEAREQQRDLRAEQAQPANDAGVAQVRERRGGDGGASIQSDGNDDARDLRRSGREARRGGETATEGQQQPGGNLVPRQRRIRTIPDTQPTVVAPTGEVQTSHRRDYRDGNYQRWTNHWRNDRRYDWRRYRDRNRSRFHLGFYYDPFGWSYRRWNIGFNLWPSYYSSRYWLNDPWQYRLPPAYGPYRWIRYHNDALLVNIYTGQVVDVIYSFFW
jgi:hypothetical protein